MILCYPKVAEVEAWLPRLDTFKLVRAKTLLPPPQAPHEISIQKIIDCKLKACDAEHRQRVEEVIGYGPG